jgi:hypothetical protein
MKRLRRRSRLQQGCPSRGLRRSADRPVFCVRSHLHQATSVLKPLKAIVGELRCLRGNKVFQVVTPARQGSAGLFAILSILGKSFLPELSHAVRQRLIHVANRRFESHEERPSVWALRVSR